MSMYSLINFFLRDAENGQDPRKHARVVVGARVVGRGSGQIGIFFVVITSVKYLRPPEINRLKLSQT